MALITFRGAARVTTLVEVVLLTKTFRKVRRMVIRFLLRVSRLRPMTSRVPIRLALVTLLNLTGPPGPTTATQGPPRRRGLMRGRVMETEAYLRLAGQPPLCLRTVLS